MFNQYQFIRLPQVKELTCLSKSSIYRLMDEEDFPKQVSLGARSVVWVKSQVEDWCSQRVAAALGWVLTMNSAQVNRRIQDFLRDLADDGTFRMRKKTGHPVCVASYGGQERSYVLCGTPGRNYQRYAVWNLNQFVSSLLLEDAPRFCLHKFFEDLWPS